VDLHRSPSQGLIFNRATGENPERDTSRAIPFTLPGSRDLSFVLVVLLGAVPAVGFLAAACAPLVELCRRLSRGDGT